MSNDPSLPSSDNNPSRVPAVIVSKPVDGEAQHPVVLVAKFDSQLVSAALLSIGVIASLVLFIVESFQYPNAATVLVPLIMLPLVQLIFKLINRKRTMVCPNCKAELAINAEKS
jgi:hypothetical protein